MSISSSYPTQTPSLNLNFATGSDQFLDSRISYTRSSSGTYLSNEKALSSENLLLQSQDFDTTWTATHMSAPTGSQTSPAGDSTAWLLSAASGTGAATLYQNASPKVSSNTSYTLVCHVKAGTASHAYVSFRGAPAESAYAMIDFASPLSPTSGGAVMTGISSSSVALGNSWYRLTLTFTTATISGGYSFIYVGTSDGTLPLSGGYANYDSTGDTMYAWGAQLSSTNSKVYDSPTTTQISREYAPLLKTASAGVPRFEYDPAADGQSEGLLIESQATNLVAHSADFDDSSWTKVRSEIDSSAAIAPDGSLTADYFRAISDSTNGAYVAKSMSVSLNATVNVSLFHKKTGGDNYALITTYSGANGARQWFNLSTGGLGNSTDYGSGFSVLNAGVEEVGNGWLRLNVTVSCTGSNVGVAINPSVATDGGYANSVSTTNALIWGAMLTESSSPSSYIATTSSQVSRASDSCLVAVSDFAGFADTSGAVIVDATVNNLNSGNAAAVSLQNAAGTEYIKIGYEIGGATDQSVRTYVRSNSADQVWLDAGSVSTTGSYRVGVRYEKNNVGISLNGATAVTDTLATMPIGMTTLYIGSSSTGNSLNANLKRIAYYSEPLSDANLTALSS